MATSVFGRTRERLTDRVFGEWSETDEGTDRRAAAAPTGGRARRPRQRRDLAIREDNSITVLTWDSVDDADFYEVEQREDGETDWVDGRIVDPTSGSNVVEDTECVAERAGDEDTEYDFRVQVRFPDG